MNNETTGSTTPGGETEQPLGNLGQLVGMLRADTLRYIPSVIVPAGISVASVAVFTRLFDSLEYGRYALVLSITIITIMLLSGWIGQAVLRYFPRFRAEQRSGEFVLKLTVVLTGVALFASGVFLVLKVLFQSRMESYAPFLLPAYLLIVAEIFFLSYGSVYQANLMSKDYTVVKVSRSVLRFSLALAYVLYVTREIEALILAAAVADIALIIPMVMRLRIGRHLRLLRGSADVGFLKMLAGFGLPMMGWMVASQVLGLSDRLIIAVFRGDSEVGIYSANYNLISTGFGLVSGPILTACYPIVMTAWERGDRGRVPTVISAFSRYYLLAVIPIVLSVAVFSREIVTIVLGEGFREGHTITPFILSGVAAWGLSMLGHKGLEILEKTRLMLGLVVIAAGLNVLLNLVFVPKYGYNAAAVTTLVSYLSYPVMVWWVAKRHLRWYIPWRTLGNLVVSGVVMTGALIGTRVLLLERVTLVPAMAAGLLAGLLAYVGVLVLLREVGGAAVKPFDSER